MTAKEKSTRELLAEIEAVRGALSDEARADAIER